VVRDFEGNISRLPIVINYSPNILMIKKLPPPGSVHFTLEGENLFSSENIQMDLPGNSLYRDLWFMYDTMTMPEGHPFQGNKHPQ